MRKVLLNVAVSLDGFIEGPNGEFDWCFTDQDYGMQAFFARIDSVFYGRKSYELALTLEQENSWMPPLHEFVFSNTLSSVAGNRTLVQGDIASKVHAIKNSPGKDIWLFGGAELTASLLQLGLVDEISLAVHPLVLGRGKPLFHGVLERLPLRLLEVKEYSSGLVSLTYKV